MEMGDLRMKLRPRPTIRTNCLQKLTFLVVATSVKLDLKSSMNSASSSGDNDKFFAWTYFTFSEISIIVGLEVFSSLHGSEAILLNLSAGFANLGILKPHPL